MKLLKDCIMYQEMESKGNISRDIMGYNQMTYDLDLNLIEENLREIRKKYTKYASRNYILKALENKTLIPVYNKQVVIPSSIPCFFNKQNGKLRAICNLSNYGILNKDNTILEINTKMLYSILEMGLISLGYLETASSLSMNQVIEKQGAIIYSTLFTRILDKDFSINLDPVLSDKMTFVAAKFYLISVLGRKPTQSVNQLAYSCIKNKTTQTTISTFDEELNQECYTSLDKLLEEIANKVPQLRNLTLRSFYYRYSRDYGPSTVLALEYFPCFFYLVSNTVYANGINNSLVIETAFGRDAMILRTFYSEVINVCIRG